MQDFKVKFLSRQLYFKRGQNDFSMLFFLNKVSALCFLALKSSFMLFPFQNTLTSHSDLVLEVNIGPQMRRHVQKEAQQRRVGPAVLLWAVLTLRTLTADLPQDPICLLPFLTCKYKISSFHILKC